MTHLLPLTALTAVLLLGCGSWVSDRPPPPPRPVPECNYMIVIKPVASNVDCPHPDHLMIRAQRLGEDKVLIHCLCRSDDEAK